METRVLERPLARSISLHLLFLIVAFFYVTHGPKLDLNQEPIEVAVLETDKATPKNSIVKRSAGEQVKYAKRRLPERQDKGGSRRAVLAQ